MQITANGISLEVEDHGPVNGRPLLLIMGLGMQLVAWSPGFIDRLVARGFRVIRFDNRDIGLSQRFDALGVPNLALATMRQLMHLPQQSPYTVADMAADAAGVLDALGIARAHVCGASMGGMIAQHLAASHPERVQSLTLMMTTSGARHLPGPTLKVQAAMMARPRTRDAAALTAHFVHLYHLIGSPGHPMPEGWLERLVQESLQRAYRPKGMLRQLMAILADGDRSGLLAQIQAPTQIIHGDADPLVPVPAASDLAVKIKGAALDLVPGMGHDLPPALWPRFVDDICQAAARG
ncbi:MAG: alpha/beta fold hydrolase [Burkholderiaceae bacterium]|nr:alpha/beta fold hydrolase [Roseateles sp.]MBV8470070.1 alpha/beta fold hydrolase [Burkholderiaceae bacterium]